MREPAPWSPHDRSPGSGSIGRYRVPTLRVVPTAHSVGAEQSTADNPRNRQGFALDGDGLAGSTTSTGWPSASEAALAFTTASRSVQARDDLGPVPSLSPTSIGRRDRLAGDDDDAVILPLFAHDGGHGQGQDVGVLFGDDGRVGVEAGLKLGARVGDIDLDADRPRLRVERPGDPGDLPLDGPALHRLELDQARSPGLTSAANASGTLTLIVTMSDRATMNSGGLSAPGWVRSPVSTFRWVTMPSKGASILV